MTQEVFEAFVAEKLSFNEQAYIASCQVVQPEFWTLLKSVMKDVPRSARYAHLDMLQFRNPAQELNQIILCAIGTTDLVKSIDQNENRRMLFH